MSDITVAIQSIISDISVDENGVVSITRNGICGLLGISRSTFSVSRTPQKLAEILAQHGFVNVSPGDKIPDTAVALIIEYFAFDAQKTSENAQVLYRAFAAIGIRKYFQQVAGYEEPVKDKVTLMKQMVESANQLIALYEYSQDKPGLENIVSFGIETGDKALPGKVTLDDILDSTKRTYSAQEKSAIGMYAATSYRSMTGKKPETIRVRRISKTGTKQYYEVAQYPIDFIPVIQNAIELGFGS